MISRTHPTKADSGLWEEVRIEFARVKTNPGGGRASVMQRLDWSAFRPIEKCRLEGTIWGERSGFLYRLLIDGLAGSRVGGATSPNSSFLSSPLTNDR